MHLSVRCERARVIQRKATHRVSDLLPLMREHDLMDLLKAKRSGELHLIFAAHEESDVDGEEKKEELRVRALTVEEGFISRGSSNSGVEPDLRHSNDYMVNIKESNSSEFIDPPALQYSYDEMERSDHAMRHSSSDAHATDDRRRTVKSMARQIGNVLRPQPGLQSSSSDSQKKERKKSIFGSIFRTSSQESDSPVPPLSLTSPGTTSTTISPPPPPPVESQEKAKSIANAAVQAILLRRMSSGGESMFSASESVDTHQDNSTQQLRPLSEKSAVTTDTALHSLQSELQQKLVHATPQHPSKGNSEPTAATPKQPSHRTLILDENEIARKRDAALQFEAERVAKFGKEGARPATTSPTKPTAKAAEELIDQSTNSAFYSYLELKTRPAEELEKRPYPSNVDVRNREMHLEDAEFQAVFGMTKDEYGSLPRWRKQEMKKQHLLF